MDKQEIINSLKSARLNSKQRNFTQQFDLIINLKGLDLKKPEHQVDLYVELPFNRGKRAKICAIVGAELIDNAKNTVDYAILADNITNFKKNEIKNLARDYDFFIAQANVMPKLAVSFGKIFGPRGKMPNPKAGCVVAPNANLGALAEKLQSTIRVTAKTSPVIQCGVGLETLKDEEIADNILTVFNSVIKALPNEKENVKNIYVKLTMGKPAKLEKV